ncbi:hypothetical protein T439DRAFT_306746 [Meredithblackwellia eburnea MCA 4105]
MLAQAGPSSQTPRPRQFRLPSFSRKKIQGTPKLNRQDTDKTLTPSQFGLGLNVDREPVIKVELSSDLPDRKVDEASEDSDSDDSNLDPMETASAISRGGRRGHSRTGSFASRTSSFVGPRSPPPTIPLPLPPIVTQPSELQHPVQPRSNSPPQPRTDLSRWAPTRRQFTATGLHHLPEAPEEGLPWQTPTSFPITSFQSSDLEHSLIRLLSPTIFEAFILEEEGRHSFAAYLSKTSRGTAPLELWWDLKVFERLEDQLRKAAFGIKEVYFAGGAKKQVGLRSGQVKEAIGALRQSMNTGGLDGTASTLLSSLYANEFQGYIRHRLVQHAHVRLGALKLSSADYSGLGEAFVLTNPRLRDAPIVLCSPGFSALTGYTAEQIVGRNCRFLQGNATAPASVSAIRNKLRAKEGTTQLLLNYRADGSPFWNLLSILPLTDEHGISTYFIGGQTDVTGLVQSAGTDISFLLSDNASSPVHFTPPTEFSEDVRACTQPPMLLEDEVELPVSPVLQSEASHSPFFPPSLPSRPETPSQASLQEEKVDKPKVIKRMSSLFLKRQSKSLKPDVNVVAEPLPVPTQPSRAEVALAGKPSSLEESILAFAATYEKVIMFRRSDREILSTTPSLIKSLGLPHSTPAELYNPPLLHVDFIDIVSAKSRAEGLAARAKIRSAVEEGRAVSVECSLGVPGEGIFARLKESTSIHGVLHLSPMADVSSGAVAFIAIFVPVSP